MTCMITVGTRLPGVPGSVAYSDTSPSEAESPLTHDELEDLLANCPDINVNADWTGPMPTASAVRELLQTL